MDREQTDANPGLERSSTRAYFTVLMAVLVYAVVTLALIPIAGSKGPELPSITPIFSTAILLTELSTSFVMFIWARSARAWSLVALAATYLYGSLMSIFHLLTFPGGVLQGNSSIIGTAQTPGWIFNFWLTGYGFLALTAIILEIGGWKVSAGRIRQAIIQAVTGVIALVTSVIVLSTVAVDRLPPMMNGASWTGLSKALVSVEIGCTLTSIALVLLVLRSRNIVFLLQSLVITAVACSQIFSLAGPTRYSVGWYLGRLSWFCSACVMFLFFLWQFAKQQRYLALSKEALEQRVVERTAALSVAVERSELLLREVYHRVKNNMQVIDSMLFMERRRADHDATRSMIDMLRNRVFALGLVHDQLMSSNDLKHFDVAPFLHDLVQKLNVSLGGGDQEATLDVRCDAMLVNLDVAIPLGLIATELVTNSFKHAKAHHISVWFRRLDADTVGLVVADDGCGDSGKVQDQSGTPESTDGRATSSGLGSLLVAGLVRQLRGDMKATHDSGTHVEIRFPLNERRSVD